MRHLRSLFTACTPRARSLGLLLLFTLLAAWAAPPALQAIPRITGPAPALTGMTYGMNAYKLGWFFMPNSGTPDVVIADCAGDIGSQPNGNCGAFYASPAIYVRNSIGPAPAVHQSPIPGQPNYVYAQLKNVGSGTLGRGRVHFYVGKASTGLTWPASWIGNYIGGVLYGDEIGSVDVYNLAAGASTTVGVLWNNVPDPANYNDPDARHFCLLARFVSDEDPMAYPEGWSVNSNTYLNNNIAWKNISLLDCQAPRAALDVENSTEKRMKIRLRFQVPEEEWNDPVTRHCTVTVDLGDQFYEMWKQGGGEGGGIGDYGNGTIAIYEPDAWIGDIVLPPGTRYTIHPEIIFREDESDRVFNWNIVQFDVELDEVVGGEAYQINTRCRANAMIADCSGDAGAEPNPSCGGVYWASPSIYVRNQQDGLLPGGAVHQNPVAVVDNWVYVQVRNIGERILYNAEVKLYYSKASTGLVWPASWGSNYPYSDLIGSATITNLGPNQSTTVEIKWENVPDPNDFGDPDARHFCLLARLESAEDPMTYPEGIYVLDNTRNNNNIAWKNVSIMDCDYPRAAIDIYNGTEDAMRTRLGFDVPEEDGEDNALAHFNIRVDLGAELYDKWLAAGGQGEGIEGDEEGRIRITEPHAWIGGFILDPEERHTLHTEIEYPENSKDRGRDNYQWTITQYAPGNKLVRFKPIGGETYDLRRKCRPDVMIRDYIGDGGAQPNLSLYGNFWSSPDIYIRNIDDGILAHQNPIGGQDNWVYVKIRNIGNKTLGSGTLHLYYSKASTGLVWPGSFNPGFPYGEEIDAIPVTGLAKNTDLIVKFRWNNVPDPSWFSDPDARHFCLLARFVSTEDPMVGEGPSLAYNVPYNNNIAQKNISVMDCQIRRAAVDLYNGFRERMNAELRFDVPEEDGDDNALRHFDIRVELGDELMAKWNDGGNRGEGIEQAEGNAIRITTPYAWIGGFTLEPGDLHTIHPEFEPRDDQPAGDERDEYDWTIAQATQGQIGAIGGETYKIRRTCGANVMIRDCNSDNGTEPDLACGGIYWASPAIYIRNIDDGIANPYHQNPIGGQGNWVYVQVKNIGQGTLNSGTVEVYFAKASTGLSWPSSWTGPYPYGGLVGTAPVSSLAPGASATVKMYWPNTPAPSWFGDPDARHFCLISRFVSPEDPMTYPEGPSVLANVRDNNNIAWKNVTLLDCTSPRAALDVLNATDRTVPTELHFTTPDEDANDNALAHFDVTVELGDRLMEQWAATDYNGTGVERLEGTQVRITSPQARIAGLQLQPGERQTIHVTMAVRDQDGNDDQATVIRNYQWNVTQHDAATGEVVGGETYEFSRGNCRPDILIRDCDADNGAEPSIACATHWESPAIYVRRQADGIANPVHEDPVAGRTNYVYVKVKNIGNSVLGSGRVHVYYAKASTGFTWPWNWDGSTAPYGNEIGDALVTGLPVNGETTVEIPWTGLPNLSDPDRHFCLLARFVSSEDPMTYPETWATGDNVYYNNNIAQKNITILGCSNRTASLDLRSNAEGGNNTGTLTFDVPEEEGNGILDQGPIRVRAANPEWQQRLAAMFAAGQIYGEGYEFGGGEILITQPHAWLAGIPIGTDLVLLFTFPDCDGSEALYHWRLAQYEDGIDRPTGGETYEIGTVDPVNVVPCDNRRLSFDVRVPHEMPIELRFTVPDDEGNGILDHGPIRVELGYELYAMWEAAGQPGEGIEAYGDGMSILVYDPHAWIAGLWPKQGETYTIHAEMPECDYSDMVYHWTIGQYEEGSGVATRETAYTILMGDWFGKPSNPEKGDLGRALDLTARPNPFNTATAIGFTLPAEGRVTLAIYDAKGTLVRTLLSGETRAAGRHEVAWDGVAADGRPVPAGTYFYRIGTPAGTTEKQLKLVR